MKNNNEIIDHTVLTDIQEQCDHLLPALKERKKEMHITNQDISDHTGVPIDTVRKYFAGESKSPNVYNIMSFCIYMDMSLDDLLGNIVEHSSAIEKAKNESDALRMLETENEKLKIHLDYTQKAKEGLESVAKVRMKIIYALLAICGILTILNCVFLFIDRTVPDAGFIQQNGNHPALFIVILTLTIALGLIAYVIQRIIKRKKGIA